MRGCSSTHSTLLTTHLLLTVYLATCYLLLAKQIHILENNEGLLKRDYETYEPLFTKFNLRSSSKVEANAQVYRRRKASSK